MKGNKWVQEKGVALIIALFFLLILSLLGLSLLLNTETEHLTSSNYSKTVKATYAAHAGLEKMKPYLLYDYAKDPESWGNENLVVPFGTPGSSDASAIGLPGEGYFDLSAGGTVTVPSSTPYDVPDALADAQNSTLYPATTSPAYSPEAGYEITLRNFPPGVFDPEQICVQSVGFTGKAKGLSGTGTRGTNVLEACYTAEILSIWDNILFANDGSGLSGGGNMQLVGNVHILGEGAAPGDVVYDLKGELYSCYDCGAPTLADVPFDQLLSGPEAAKTDVDAKLRIKNGLMTTDTGNGCAGNGANNCNGAGPPLEGAYICKSCPTSPYNGFTSQTSQDSINTEELAEYDIPADVQSIISFPEVTDPYVDAVTGIGYDNYSDYLIGDEDTSPFNPGVLGLRTRPAFTTTNTAFSLSGTGLATEVWNRKNELFLYNVNTNAVGVNRSQHTLDPVGADETPIDETPDNAIFNPTLGSETFMLVAADTSQGVVIVYKETGQFTRNSVNHPRQVHGFVYAPSSATMGSLALNVDLDGADLDVGDGTEDYSHATLTLLQSQDLVRKVVNALWLSSQKSCGEPCYTSVSQTDFHSTIQATQISDNNASNGNLDVGTLGNFFVGYGVIQTTDDFQLGDLTYMGRMTMFIDEPDGNPGSGSICDFSCAEIQDDLLPIESYQSGNWYAFPCQNNMGILASDDLRMEANPQSDKAGAFYASDTMRVTAQYQILGAMVSDIWDFGNGGNPDFFQAMEIARCLPPYMIGDETVPVLGTTRYVER